MNLLSSLKLPNFQISKFLLLLSACCFLPAAFCLLSSCTSEKEKHEQQIKATEIAMYGDSTVKVDFSKAKELLKLYADYEKQFPEDEKAGDYLFKAGELSMGMHQGNLALKYFSEFYEKYPQNEKAPVSLFMQGFIYETQLQDIAKAKTAYEDFIAKYPQHKLVNDAKYSIANLGKSDEDLIKEFQKMQGDTVANAARK